MPIREMFRKGAMHLLAPFFALVIVAATAATQAEGHVGFVSVADYRYHAVITTSRFDEPAFFQPCDGVEPGEWLQQRVSFRCLKPVSCFRGVLGMYFWIGFAEQFHTHF